MIAHSRRRAHVVGRRQRPALLALRYAILAAALLFFLFPIYWVFITAFKLPGEYLANPPIWFPRQPTLVHFAAVMPLKGYAALKNSLIIASSATALALAVGSLAAYSLTRLRTGGDNLLLWLLSQRMMPPVVLVIPLFLLLRAVGGIDTHLGLIVLYTMFNLPYVIWMQRSYFADVPVEVEESALVDGCSRPGVFWRITLPLSIPGLIATGTFTFIFSWTEFLFALIFTRTAAVTLPVTISGYYGSQGAVWGQAAALAIVATLPLFVLGLLLQRHFIRGLTLGAVRG
jgi:multiple sugar transport system permease protein